MPIQGDFPSLSGAGSGGGASAGWVNVSALIDLTGAPLVDPAAQWVTGSSGPSGTSITVKDTTAYGTVTHCVTFYIGQRSTLFPGMPQGAGYEIRYTPSVDAPVLTGLWMGIGHAGASPPASGGLNAGTGDNAPAGGGAFQGIVTGSTLFAAGGAPDVRLWAGVLGIGSYWGSYGVPGTDVSNVYGNAEMTYWHFQCGCLIAGGSGPHTMSGLWELRAVQ